MMQRICLWGYFQLTSYSSSHLVVYLGERNSCRIFQLRLVPEEANLSVSSRIEKLILSIMLMSRRWLFFSGGRNKLACTEESGTSPLSITPAFLYSLSF